MKISPCPFCRKADSEVSNRPRPSRESWNVECNSCGAEGPSSFDSPEDAIELWNARGEPSDATATLRVIEDMIDNCPDVPRDPTSLPMVVLAYVRAALASPTKGTSHV